MTKAPILSVLACGLLLYGSPAGVQAQDAEQSDRLPSAQAVIDWSIEAHGGREVHEKLETRKARGTYSQSNDTFEAEVYHFQQRPRLSRSETLLFNGELVIQVVGEDVAWQDYNGSQRVLKGKAKAQAQRGAAIDGLTDWKDFYETAEMTGVEDFGESRVRVVRLTAGDGLHTDLLFDTESRLLVAKRERRHIDDDRTYPVLSKYSNFKEFDGILLPMKIEHVQGEGEKQVTITTTFKRYEHNVPLPSDVFETPPEIQALIDDADGGD